MADNKEYFSKEVDNGSIQISEEVVASVAAMAALDVEGVCGLSSNIGTDIAEMLGRKTLAKGIRITTVDRDTITIDCDVVAKFGQSLFDLAKDVQTHLLSEVESVTGLKVSQANVNICGIALPKDLKK